MSSTINLKKFSFLIFGLGSTGISVIKYFKKRKIYNFTVWDDKIKLRKRFKSKLTLNLKNTLKKVDYIVLSPGINLNKTKYKKVLTQFRKKIITDIDLLYLSNPEFKSIVVTGTNGKSTTCKILAHLLKKNNFNVEVGGNIGNPVLNIKIKRNTFLIIEASSFQLFYSKHIHPTYAILLNITNDHLDWHGSMQAYIKAKLKIFSLQDKSNFALVNNDFKKIFKRKKYLSRIASIQFKNYKKVKSKIKNSYLKFKVNEENMKFVYTLSKLLKINDRSFIKSMNSFIGLPHRYEVFLKKKNIMFVNDSKATSFEATKFALANSKNIYWILGGLPKDNDKIFLKYLKSNIIKSYIIGKNVNFFKKQLKNKVKFSVVKNLKDAIIYSLKDIKLVKKKNNTILLSPCAASFDQFENFEDRGEQFKKLSRFYAKKYI